jgi:hypothetical protein
MTLLDDYEARYKLQGVLCARAVLEHVPATLLRRTGVDGLLKQSLHTCLGQLDDPASPQLIRNAIIASLELTKLTLTRGSKDYFDRLCELLGDGIVGTVWAYGYRRPELLAASVDALTDVIRTLGTGSVRYLKVRNATNTGEEQRWLITRVFLLCRS